MEIRIGIITSIIFELRSLFPKAVQVNGTYPEYDVEKRLGPTAHMNVLSMPDGNPFIRKQDTEECGPLG